MIEMKNKFSILNHTANLAFQKLAMFIIFLKNSE